MNFIMKTSLRLPLQIATILSSLTLVGGFIINTQKTTEPPAIPRPVNITDANNGYIIDLNLVPEVVEFEGFVNYGAPINSAPNTTLMFGSKSISQPVFSIRRINPPNASQKQ